MELHFTVVVVILLFLLSYTNGANDVSKPIATLAGAGVTSVRGAIAWGTLWTVGGALLGLVWGTAMIKNISENIYIESPDFYLPFALAVASAPILWVGLATWRCWPVSTTHALVGSLVGAGVVAHGAQGINWPTIFAMIVLPLLVSPFMAIGLSRFLGPYLGRAARTTSRIRLCLSPVPKLALVPASSAMASIPGVAMEDCIICSCESPQASVTHGLTLSIDTMHWITSGLLSFSRGLNDTPKLIAIVMPFMIGAHLVAPAWLFLWAALAMGLGSWLGGRNITKLLGFKVTKKMSHEEGFAANFVSAFLVIGASRFGLPVSTTHVSASSIMGVGMSRKKGLNMKTVRVMIFAWLVTAPVTALFAVALFSLAARTGLAG